MGSGADMSEERKVLSGRTKGTGDFNLGRGIDHTVSSGDVFADLGIDRPDCDPFPVKLCPRCESLEADCTCDDSPLRALEEAVASWRAACDNMESAMLDFLAATWRRT